MMAEIFGRRTGSCRGKGGSMHIADLSKGMLGANGIVGGGPPLICGTALAAKAQGDGGVGVAFFGDGASNQGTTLEAMNLASVWNLPAIFVAENNGYAEATSSPGRSAADNIADRAAGFGMPGAIVDGFDFFAVYEAAGEAIKRARQGGGPTLLEVKLIRYYGHFEGDQQKYRGPNEVANARENLDCLKRFRPRVVESGRLTDANSTRWTARSPRSSMRPSPMRRQHHCPRQRTCSPTSTSSTDPGDRRRTNHGTASSVIEKQSTKRSAKRWSATRRSS